MSESVSGWLAYADGSCIGNPGNGGWGVVLINPGGATIELAGADPATTNNRMEITAAIEALRRVPPGAQVLIRSDSQYVVKTMTMGWRRRENLDLWGSLDQEVARRKVRWEWVRGHNGDLLNERADELARAAAEDRPASSPRASTGPAPTARLAAAPIQAAPAPGAELDDRTIVSRLTPLLNANEDVRHCRACRRLFVSRDNAHFCALATCQLKSRAVR